MPFWLPNQMHEGGQAQMSTPASIRDSFIHQASKGEWLKILFGIFFPTWGGGGGGGGGGGEGGGGHQSPNFMFTK